MEDIDIVEFRLHGHDDKTPMQFITAKRLAYFERVVAAIRGLDAANRELRAAMNDAPPESTIVKE